ncbi:lipase 3-like isoform X2 [Anthonomus grandis grandis]|uniref:lipase 3-like isoform X2 n=1 Tax=Anthonomus grandis grandis TaxID=2921223 RepID=UPI002165EE0E|nr:lipase 3-like isoform X2 [Anthonomus grandis grandis]
MHFCTKFLIVITAFCSYSMELKQPIVSYILNKINNSEEGTNSRADPLSKNVEGLEKLLSETEALNQTEKIYTVEHLVKSNGYPIETHYVTTGDGYILRVHRIPSSPKMNASNGKVAFLQHGILCSAADWVITGSEKGLGFLLADAGYDVWMGNARGNTWSRNHTTLNPDKDAKFWKFSFHEIGLYDIPAMIDYALEKTGASSVYYVGHSQGTTAYYVMLSELPAYNSKIKMAANLAPIAFLNHMSPLFQIMSLFEPMGNVISVHGVTVSLEIWKNTVLSVHRTTIYPILLRQLICFGVLMTGYLLKLTSNDCVLE